MSPMGWLPSLWLPSVDGRAVLVVQMGSDGGLSMLMRSRSSVEMRVGLDRASLCYIGRSDSRYGDLLVLAAAASVMEGTRS